MAQSLKAIAAKGGDARTTSYGRGGAGNISNGPNAGYDAKDLSTPTIKSTTYTTGRGGSGKLFTPYTPYINSPCPRHKC